MNDPLHLQVEALVSWELGLTLDDAGHLVEAGRMELMGQGERSE